MPALIRFPVREDRLRAIDILAEAGEGYDGAAPQCYLVSNAAVELLKTQGVHFEVVGATMNEVERK